MSVVTEPEATRRELLEASDETIEDAVQHADPMALRGLLYQLTGDESLVEMPVKLVEAEYAAEIVVLADPADGERIRAKAVELLQAYRDRGAGPVELGPPERLPRSLELAVGEEIPGDELELWLEELALDRFARGLEWQEPPPPDRLAEFSVVVIGAGMGGLNAAVLLKRAGIRFTVVEKNPAVGGTWLENRYPGIRVDSPSRNYTHVFGVDYIYPGGFCDGEENRRYFEWVADRFGLRDDIVFDTEVTSCEWDDESATWRVEARGPGGTREWRSDAVISAVGLLSRPSLPQIEGMETFAGPSFHTARWPTGFGVEGKRVAVVGTGCSGYQTAPELALAADRVLVFQRTAQWVLAMPRYRSPFAPQVNWLDRNVPYYVNFMRFRVSWMTGPKTAIRIQTIDPEWDDPLSVSATNRKLRDSCLAVLERKLGKSRPELLEKMIPPHPVWSARMVVVDEEYSILDALVRDNVELVTDRIRRITPRGIETDDGREHEVDVIVYATGFRANEFLWPMEVRGRGGQRVEELWADDGPRAFLGCMLPGFPNLFLVYGPNTNPFGGLGVCGLEEMVTRYALECLEHLILHDRRSVEPTVESYRRYNDELDRAEQTKPYSDRRARSYYRNEFGRSATNCPFPSNRMWAWLRRPDLADLVVR
jgi:4-hydroxyacetophenone monooxygenase